MRYLLSLLLVVSGLAAGEPWSPGQSVFPNLVLAGPSSGMAQAKPVARSLVLADIGTPIWVGFNGYGLNAARPVASASNAGYLYFSTDVSGGTLYRSNGATWDSISGATSVSTATLPLIVTGVDVALGTAVGPTTADPVAAAIWSPPSASDKALVLQSVAAQTAPLLELQDSTGTALSYFSSTGRLFTPRIEAILPSLDIDGLDMTSGNNNGGGVTLTTGLGSGTGAGGWFSIFAGASGSGATGNGGGIQIYGGNSNATDGDGGDIEIYSGNAAGTGTGGSLSITGGNSPAAGGFVAINGGSSTVSGNGGELVLSGGTSAGATGGSVYIDGGAGTGADGDIHIGTYDAAAIFIGQNSTPSINIGNNGSITYLSGILSFQNDVRQTFSPGNNVASLNVGEWATDPISPLHGDLWYNSTSSSLKAYIAGASYSLLYATYGPLTSTQGIVNLGTANGPSTSDIAADVIWGTSNATQKALVLQGGNSQTANLFEVQDNTGALLASVSYNGTIYSSVGLETPSLNVADIISNSTNLDINNTLSNGTISIVSGPGGTNLPGGDLTVNAGDGNGTGNGGQLYLSAGNSGLGATGTGGPLYLRSGQSAATNGAGGPITLDGGAGNGTGNGGDITIIAGPSGTGATGNGGNLTLGGGQSNAVNGIGGGAAFAAGVGNGAGGGGATLITGGGNIGGGGGGSLTLYGGLSTAGTGGDVYMYGGDGVVDGSVHIGGMQTTFVTIGASGQSNTFGGTWSWPDNVRQTFNPGATVSGFNVGSHAGNPSTPTAGDIWYNSTASAFVAYDTFYGQNARVPLVGSGGSMFVGHASFPANDVYFGYGLSNANPSYVVMRPSGQATGESNESGGDIAIRGATHTGAATTFNAALYQTGSVRLQTILPGSSGTSQSTQEVDRHWVRGIPVTLSDNTAQTLCTMTVPTLRAGGGRIEFTVEVTDGVDVQSCSGFFQFNAINKADTFTTDPNLTSSTVVSAGTLAVSFSFTTTGATDAVAVRITSDTSLAATTHRVFYTVYNESGCIIALP